MASGNKRDHTPRDMLALRRPLSHSTGRVG